MATSSESVHPAGQPLVDLVKASGNYERSFDVIVKFRVKEGKENEILEVIKVAVPESRKEKGVLQYDISRDVNEPVFFIKERYENGAIFENHLSLSHTKALLDKIGEVSSELSANISTLIV